MDTLAVTIQHVEANGHRTLLLSIVGPLIHGTAPSLRSHLRTAIGDNRPAPRLLLDLRCCTDIDVDGLLALSVAQHAARMHGGDLQLVDPPVLIQRQIRQHNFHDLLPATAPDEPQGQS